MQQKEKRRHYVKVMDQNITILSDIQFSSLCHVQTTVYSFVPLDTRRILKLSSKFISPKRIIFATEKHILF